MLFLLTSEGESSMNEKNVGLERTRAMVICLTIELVLKGMIYSRIQCAE